MKATGIVRRIDDLGRIVIPKEIRKTLKIQEGNPLEIFTDAEGSVIFRKYSPVGEMSALAELYAQTVFSVLGRACAVCDTDRVIAVAGAPKKDLLEKLLSEELRTAVMKKKTLKITEKTLICEAGDRAADLVVPVVASGDAMGAVLLLDGMGRSEKGQDEALCDLIVKTAAMLLGKQAE